MQASAGIFPDESRKLLSEIPNNAEKRAVKAYAFTALLRYAVYLNSMYMP